MLRALFGKMLKAARIAATLNPTICLSLRHGVAASTEHFNVLASLAPIGTVIDIGANRGQFSLAARYSFPQATIFAFEPLEQPFATYQCIFGRDQHVRIYNFAIGAERSSAPIHISGRDDSSSLLPITAAQDQLFPGTREVGTTTIEVERLDALVSLADLQGTTLLKIDVQGFEAQALHGSTGLLEGIHYIYIECSFVELYESQVLVPDIIDWLHRRGFMLSGVFNMAYDQKHQAVQADFLFRKSRNGAAAK